MWARSVKIRVVPVGVRELERRLLAPTRILQLKVMELSQEERFFLVQEGVHLVRSFQRGQEHERQVPQTRWRIWLVEL